MIYYLLIIVIDLNDHGILQTDHENQLEHQQRQLLKFMCLAHIWQQSR